MTRIVEEGGKLVLKSFSHFGPSDEADVGLRRTQAYIEKQNRRGDAMKDLVGNREVPTRDFESGSAGTLIQPARQR